MSISYILDRQYKKPSRNQNWLIDDSYSPYRKLVDNLTPEERKQYELELEIIDELVTTKYPNQKNNYELALRELEKLVPGSFNDGRYSLNLRFELIDQNKNSITYRYYCENITNKNFIGSIEFSLTNANITNIKCAKFDEFYWYSGHLTRKFKWMQKVNTYENSGILTWHLKER